MAIYLGGWALGLGLAGVLVWGEANFLGSPTLAQMTPDATLGAENSVVTPNVNVRGFVSDRIDGGAVRGANLFHSFQEFNVGNGQRVYFANPTGIANILSRVTGNNLSNILGTLGVDGGANLFLLNPNGIIFGSNAQLDIAGSFVASTADSVVFDNGFEFSASNPESPPLLTVNVPLGVQYGTNQPRTTITNTGNLAVGQNLALDAGNLDLQGQLQAGKDLTLQAQDTVKVRDSVTHPFIAAAGGRLLVQGNETVDIFALNHPSSGLYSGGDMVLRSPNSIIGDAHYWSGGNFRIEQLDGSSGDLESPNDPIIRASGDVTFTNYTGASLHILAGGSVNISGSVTITGADTLNNSIAENVTLSDGITVARVNGSTRPTLDIRAGTTAFNPTGITPFDAGIFTPGQPGTGGTGTSANITILGKIDITEPNGLVFLTNQYQPNTTLPPGNIQLSWIETITNGNSGDVFIDSRGNITLPPGGVIATSSRVGNPGDVTLISNGSFSLINGAQIRSDIIGNQQANAGDVTIKVLGDVTISGYGRNVTGGFSNSGIATQVEQGGRGNSGNIYIQARSLLSNDGGGLSVSLLGQGSAGQIAVRVDDFVTLTNGGFISSNVLGGGAGNAGTIEINAPGSVTLSGFSSTDGLRSGLRARVNPGGVGQAGSINVNTGNFRVNNGANVDTSTFSLDGGRITINANSLEVAGGGQVLTASSGTGKAGDLLINATDFVNVNTQGLVTTGSTGTGSGGSLSINTRQFNISDSGSVVGTNSFGSGKAGDLLISATNSVNVSNQGLLTTGSLSSANGGKLSISTRRLDVINGGVDGGISTAALGTGTSGALSVVATDSINVVSGSNIITSAKQGVAGRLEIETGKLSIRDNSFVVTSTFGAGSGDLTVRATESIEVVNVSGLSTSTNGSGNAGNVIIETPNLVVDSNSKLSGDTFSSGNGGDMSITTEKLSVRNGGEVSTGVYPNSSGNGGKLSVNATDSVDLNGGSLVTLTVGSGAAGDLDVNTRRLTAQNGGRIEARTASLSPGGAVTVNASESIELIGNSGSGTNQPAAISAFSDNLSIGNAPSGNINLTTGELIIRDGAEVTTATLGRGEGGDIRVQANSLSLSNNGNITSRSTGQVNAGNAGNIFVNLNDKLQSNGGIISTTSERAGGGDINITADDIRLRKSSLISSSVFDSTGGGGNITISSTVFLAIEDSDILANAEAGPGGNITINSSAFLADLFSRGVAVPVGRNPGDLGRFRGNGRNDISVSAAFRGNDRVDISADSRTGTSGAVVIRGSFSERRVNPLPSWVDAEELIDRRCTPSSSTKTSRFTITGRGGLPPSPNDPLMYQDELVDWVTLENREETPSSEASNTDSTPSNPQQLVEAQGWVIGADGQIMLTASASTVTPGNSGLGYPSCEENKATTD